MNPTILNREFKHPEDGWYMIEPKGEFPNRRSGIVQVIDDTACAAMVAAFNREAASPSFPGMLIDHEHFKHDDEKETRAYGWLMALENRSQGEAPGVYGQIKWSTVGQAAVDGAEYRYFSTEYDPGDLKVLNGEGAAGRDVPRSGKRVRPVRLDGLTLTNNPNNKGGKPITNREPESDLHNKEFRRGSGESSVVNQNQKQNKTMKTVATKLGLSAEASEEAILAAVTTLHNRAETAEGKVTPLTNRVNELQIENTQLASDQVDGILAEHGIKEEKVINRLKPTLLPLKNRADRVAFLTDLGHKPSDGKGQRENGKVINRGDAGTPNRGTATPANEPERALKIRNRATELKKDGMSYDSAFAQAMQENPASN